MRSKLLPLFLFTGILPVAVFAYNAPIGIPNPATGADVSHPGFGWEIDRATPAWPASWTAGTTSATTNYYYVDKTAGNATDVSNTYGHPGLPRKTIPEGLLTAGAYVYVNAGTYTSADSVGDRFDWHGAGTTANPIWITGNPTTRPVFQDLCQIGQNGNASFIVFENFVFNTSTSAALKVTPGADGGLIDHVLIRNIARTGTQTSSDAEGIVLSISQATDVQPNSMVTDIVIYNNVISNIGDPSPTGSDTHGVEGGYHTNRVWILNNTIHHVGGDSVQANHYANYTTMRVENYFIGGNTFYGNGENGIDLKNMQGFVISQNEIYGPFQREAGWGMVFHYGSQTAFHCANGVVLFNQIHHVSGGIYTGLSSGVDNLDVIGNKIWDVHASYAYLTDPLNGACIQLGGTTVGANSLYRFTDNTFHDFDRGVTLDSIHDGDVVKLHGNIFSSKANASLYELAVSNHLETGVTLDYNLYTGTPSFLWAGSTRTLSYMKTTAGQETHAVVGSPAFVDATNGDFHLTDTSPAIDVSVEGPVGDSAYAAFQTKYSLDVRKDFDGRVRPVDGAWDIGALESALPPRAPSGLIVHP
jgi:parallel beta-helix repeat protein